MRQLAPVGPAGGGEPMGGWRFAPLV